MGKDKKGKVVSMPKTPGNYFKSGRARQLPVYECLISEDWQDGGIVFVLMARKHVNGNISWATYLVDTYLLGIRDTVYVFNQPEEDYKECKEESVEVYDLIPCSYTVIHNVIYGAVDFAGIYGFGPCKDFNVSRFLLKEREDGHVKKMDIEFGIDGRPAYLSYPGDEQFDRVISSLERTAGKGNFTVIVGEEDEDEDDDEWDEDFEDEWDEDFEDDWDDDEDDDDVLFQEGEMEEIMNGKKDPDPFQAFVLLSSFYTAFFPNEEDCSIVLSEFEEMEEELERLLEEKIPDNPEYYPDSMEVAAHLTSSMRTDGTPEEGLAGVEKMIREHPNVYDLYQLRLLIARFAETPAPDALFEGFYKRFPGRPLSKILRCGQLITMGEPEKAFDVLNRKYHMTEAFPENEGVFSGMEIFSFHAVMCRYYAAVDDLTTSRFFASCIVEYGEMGHSDLTVALTDLMTKMTRKIDIK